MSEKRCAYLVSPAATVLSSHGRIWERTSAPDPLRTLGPRGKLALTGHGGEHSRWFELANELALTGRYRNFGEVETALKAREADAILPANQIARGFIDGTCYRVRKERGWDT